MYSYIPLVLALVGSAMSQSTTTMTVTMPPTAMNRTWSGSIYKAEPSMTQIDLKCGAATATATTTAPPCEFTNGIRISQGPSVWGYSVEENESRTYFASCSFSASQTMTCSGSVVTKVVEGSSTVTRTTTDANTVTNMAIFPAPATITSGVDKLAAAATSTKVSTGGLPRMTQNAVLAGVAAVVGGVVMI